MVSKPTRVRAGQASNILDLVMVNEENFISNIKHYSPIGKSDHETLLFTLYTGLDKSNEQEVDSRFDLNKGNYNAMRDSIAELDWTTTLNGSMDQCWESIKGVILKDAVQAHSHFTYNVLL